MELREEVKKDPKMEYPYLLVDVFRNLGDEINLKGGRIVTP